MQVPVKLEKPINKLVIFQFIFFSVGHLQGSQIKETRIFDYHRVYHKFQCESEGFFPDPEDCDIFYRCLRLGNLSENSIQFQFTSFKFQCRTGAVFDPKTISCIPSKVATRLECNEHSKPLLLNIPRAEPMQEDIDYGVIQEQGPKPTSQQPSYSPPNQMKPTNQVNNYIHEKPQQNQNQQQQHYMPPSSTSSQSTFDSNSSSQTSTSNGSVNHSFSINADQCSKEGFFPSATSCRKFYWCVKNKNETGYTKYEFNCGPGTVFDPENNVCNYPSVVQNDKCGTSGGSQNSTSQPTNSDSNSSSMKTSTTSSTTQLPQFTQNSTPFYQTMATTENSTNGEMTTLPTANQMQHMTSESSCKKISCMKAGFYPHPTNCRKFYRCVDQDDMGKRFSIFYFNCPAGTVFDPSLNTCNHENVVYPPRNCNWTNTASSLCEADQNSQSSTGTITNGMLTTTLGYPVGSFTKKPSTVQGQESGNQKCAELKDNQFALVCPTGFRRHPKYCNLFYQCTTLQNNEIKVTTLSCKNGMMYNNERIQCLPPEEAEKCDGSMMNTSNLRKIIYEETVPIPVKSKESICPNEGLFEYKEDCRLFYKCMMDDKGKLHGFIYQCPEEFVFSKKSRRCEKIAKTAGDSEKETYRSALVPVEIIERINNES